MRYGCSGCGKAFNEDEVIAYEGEYYCKTCYYKDNNQSEQQSAIPMEIKDAEPLHQGKKSFWEQFFGR